MAGNAERRVEYIKQLIFDTLAAAPPDNAEAIQEITPTRITAKSSGEVRRSAPVRRKAKKPSALPEGIQQHTLDEIFTTIPREADIPLAITPRESRYNNEPITQLSTGGQKSDPSC